MCTTLAPRVPPGTPCGLCNPAIRLSGLSTGGEGWPQRPPRPRRSRARAHRPTCRSSPSGTCGCTSRPWAPTPTARCRSSSAARAATSSTSTASATSTGWPRCSASTPATAAPSWARPRRARWRSSPSTPTGPTPTRGRSSWPTRVAKLAPGDLNRVFFTSGGSEAVESALKVSAPSTSSTARRQRTKFIAREIAYHGTTLGALAATGITPLRTPFEPLTPGGAHVANTNSYRWPEDRDPLWAADADRAPDRVRGPRDGRRRDPRARAERRRLLPAAGGLLPAGAGDLRQARRPAHLRRGHLLVGPAGLHTSAPSATATSPTSSPRRRA